MPALNFQKQFAYKVESGEKRQTIRKLRKRAIDNPRSGQTLYLYTGMRTKSCQKLGEVICKSVDQITIEENGDIVVGIDQLDAWQESKLVEDDGFNTLGDFLDFFRKTYKSKPFSMENDGLPFYGLLIKW